MLFDTHTLSLSLSVEDWMDDECRGERQETRFGWKMESWVVVNENEIGDTDMERHKRAVSIEIALVSTFIPTFIKSDWSVARQSCGSGSEHSSCAS